MNKMHQAQNDEIDLLELFETLWSGKWLIAGFTILSLMIGGVFLALSEAKYESKILIKIDNRPPLYEDEKILFDFEKLFFSLKIFEDWKKSSGNTSLTFNDLSKTENVDGFELSIDQNDQLVLFTSEKKSGKFFILIRSGQLEFLDGLLNYSSYLKNLVNKIYLKRAKSDLILIEKSLDNLSVPGKSDDSVQTLLLTDRFVTSLENGGDVFIVEKPTFPIKTSPKLKIVLALSVVLGGMIGTALVLVRNAISKRKDQLTKA